MLILHFQLIIDGLSRILLLHGRASKSFQWTVTSIPEDTDLGSMEEGICSRNGDLAKDSQKGEATELTTDIDNSQLETTAFADINIRLQHMESLIKDQAIVPKKQNNSIKILKLQWMAIALVMDRLFFCMYFITLIVSLLVLFPRPL